MSVASLEYFTHFTITDPRGIRYWVPIFIAASSVGSAREHQKALVDALQRVFTLTEQGEPRLYADPWKDAIDEERLTRTKGRPTATLTVIVESHPDEPGVALRSAISELPVAVLNSERNDLQLPAIVIEG